MNSSLFKYLSSLIAFAISFGYIGIIFLMILESCALPVSSEIVLGTAGFLSGQGKFNFYLVILSATAGTLIGSSLLYLIGVKGGRIFLEKYGKYLLISKKDIEKADKWFAKYGSFAVFIGIMLPVIKTYIGFPPGASLMNYKKFAVFVVAGSLIYNTVVVYLGLKLGQNIYLIKPFFHKMGLAMIIIIFILFAIYIYAHVKKAFAK
ncbi:MAG: DedA family protein [Candidatus Acididesulfobacter diazotrophicus]|jgi:membrane protein DedA with SNARE-associated domain|uniref:DedA family protein n=1 Tax=Candidatus Acididesulfobacter diazotrophicus TaxID=2597226 RepID=A0A519BMR9_9DELT|nr:MAG: DedA family protein [Candidatus Acididesulfobacter diazotrophicus]